MSEESPPTGATAEATRVSGRLRSLLRHARPHRRILAVVLVLTLASSAAGLAQPLVAQRVLTALAAGTDFMPYVLLLVGLLLVSALLTGSTIWFASRTSERIVLHLRRGLVHRLLRLRVAEGDRMATGDLTMRVTSDTTVLQLATSSGLIQVLDGSLTVVAAFVLMAFLDWTLFLATCLVLAGVAVIVGFVVPRIRQTSQRGQEELGALGATLERALGAARTVKANAAERVETDTADQAAHRAYLAGLRGARYDAVIGVVSGVAVQASFLLVLGTGGVLVAAGRLDIATLIAFLLFMFRITGPIVSLLSGVSSISQGAGALARIEEIHAMDTEDDVDVDHPRLPGRPPRLEFDGVSFSYSDRIFEIERVSFCAQPATCVALVGPSGAGKTTIFALIERFYEPEGGRILLDDVDIATITRAELRQRIAYVEQDCTMLAGTIRENLCYGTTDPTDAELADALAATELTAFVDELPDGLDTQVGARGSMLSGGQRQRLAIARALLRRPDVLLLDEITAQLDARNEHALRRTVAAAATRCTVVMIAHRLSTVISADNIVVMQDGEVRASGRHQDLLTRDELYRELAATQLLAPETPATADVAHLPDRTPVGHGMKLPTTG